MTLWEKIWDKIDNAQHFVFGEGPLPRSPICWYVYHIMMTKHVRRPDREAGGK